MKGSYHIALEPSGAGSNRFIHTGGYIPQWISAYRYEGHWENERTIREDKDIQTCTGDRLLVIREDDIVCKRWEDLPTDCGPHVTVPDGDLNKYRCLIYKTATGWDFD